MVDIDDYNEMRECDYRGEHYSVRDNGSILRHQRKGKPKRKYDDVWTFGKPNEKKGYMYFSSEFVHRIVAYAFHGAPPADDYVVDHIDTNRRNNRPENLRWLTKLENVLKNPITRARIENICGSIEKFLENPSILRWHEKIDPNFKWMHTVTPEEARVSKELLLEWSKHPTPSKGGQLGEWIYRESQNPIPFSFENFISPNMSEPANLTISENSNEFENKNDKDEEESELILFKSLTSNAVQINWRTPSEFPCCPKKVTETPLDDYTRNLKKGVVFSQNNLFGSNVKEWELSSDKTKLYVLCENTGESSMKPYSFAVVSMLDGLFAHESGGTYFEEQGAKKYYTLAQGKEWTGGDVFDDYC